MQTQRSARSRNATPGPRLTVAEAHKLARMTDAQLEKYNDRVHAGLARKEVQAVRHG